MYLERRSVRDLPKDAIVISDNEAFDMYQKHIYNSKFFKEVWPFKYGFAFPGLIGIFTSYSLINYYRNRLKLGVKGRILLPIACSGMPAIFSFILHLTYIQKEIILQKACSSCTKIRSVLYHNIFAVGYPLVPGPFLAFLLAIQLESYPVPGFSTIADASNTAKLYVKFTQRIYPRILIFILLNSISAWYITSREFKSLEAINRRLKEQDEKLRELVKNYQTSN